LPKRERSDDAIGRAAATSLDFTGTVRLEPGRLHCDRFEGRQMTGRGARMTVPQDDHRDPSRRGAADSAASQADVELAVRRYVHFILSARHKRRKYMGKRLFAEPAWDILLHLYAAELGDEQSLSLEWLTDAAQVPASTVLRWVHALEADGFVASKTLPADPAQTFVNLSETGRTALGSYFRDIATATPPP